MAIQYAPDRRRASVILVHKGDIMKFPDGKLLVKDRLADGMFQQILTRPAEYDVVATSNLNGDYLSGACAALVGGLGMAPGANVGDGVGAFEASRGTAPKYAGRDVSNPGALMLSGAMMLRYLGWDEAAALVERGLEQAIGAGQMTHDLARQRRRATELGTSAFADAVISHM